MKLSFHLFLFLAAAPTPASPFSIVFMGNYLENLGGPGQNKAVGSGKKNYLYKGPGSTPPSPLPPPPPTPPQPEEVIPVMASVEDTETDEPVMQAMTELTQNFMQNEQATLLALKEISASLKILADQKAAGRQAAPAPAVAPPAPQPMPQPPPPQPAVASPPPPSPPPVPVPAPPPPQPVTETPKPVAPVPAPKPVAPAKPAAPATTTVASGGNYLDAIAGGGTKGKPQLKPSTFKPSGKQPGPVSGGVPGSYLGNISSGTSSTPRDGRTKPDAGSKDARALVEEPIDDGEGMVAGTFVTLTLAGIGLLWAFTTGDFSGGDGSSSSNTVTDLPKVSIPETGKSASSIKVPSSDSVKPLPEKAKASEVKAPPKEPAPAAKKLEALPAAKSPAQETKPAPTVPAPKPTAPEAPKAGFGAKLGASTKTLKESLPPAAPVLPATPSAPATGAVKAGAVAAAVGQANAIAAQAQAATEAPIKAGTPFSYDPTAKEGPTGWSNLSIEGNQCGGKKQSPIAIATTGCNVDKSFQFTANDQCMVSNLDYTLGRGGPKATFTKDCNGNLLKIPVLEGNFEAQQFHTHIGSEHVIDGKRYGAELHIVHKEVSGDRFAVVGIMVNGDAKADNPLFGRLLNRWAAVEQKVATSCDGATKQKSLPFSSDSSFNVYDLIPTGTSFYHYDGSLTTPPCSEVVWWEVADKPLSVSPEQYEQLVKLTTTYTDPATCEVKSAASPMSGSTNRPIAQDLSGREITRICPADGDVTPTTVATSEKLLSSTSPLQPFITVPSDGSRITKDLPGDEDRYAGM